MVFDVSLLFDIFATLSSINICILFVAFSNLHERVFVVIKEMYHITVCSVSAAGRLVFA